VDQCFADRAVGGLAPGLGFDEARIAFAAAIPLAAAFLAIALPCDDRNIDPHQRADIAVALAVGTVNLHHLPGRAETDRDLSYPRILVADIGIDFGEQLDLALEARCI